MATNTTARGYRYPDGVETPALDILLGHLAQDVDADTQSLADRIDVLGDTGWITPILLNGWVPYGAGYVAPRYRRLNGVTIIQGTAAATGSFGTAFVLPAGFRASGVLAFVTFAGSGAAWVLVHADGTVDITGCTAGASSARVGLNGVTFPADA